LTLSMSEHYLEAQALIFWSKVDLVYSLRM